MCPWVGPNALSFGRQLPGLPSSVEYLSPPGVLLPLFYGTTTSPLLLELRGLTAWQATPSLTVHQLACHQLPPWLRVSFAMVPDAASQGSDQWPWGTAPATGLVGRLGCPSASHPWRVGSFLSLGRPTCACVCGVLGHLAPAHRCARWVRCFVCAVSWATWLLFTGGPARCVALLVRRPGPIGSCSLVCPRGLLCCVCNVLGHLAPFCRCVRSVCCVACAASWATWLPFGGVPARCVAFCVRCPGPLGSCSRVPPLSVLLSSCGILGHLAPVHRCVRMVCCVACAVSWATWLLFTGAPARCVALLVRRPGPLSFRSPVPPLGVLCGVRGVLGHLAPVYRCACSVCCVACAVFWARQLLFTGVPARFVVFCCVCGLLGQSAPDHLCACSVLRLACAVSLATKLLFTGVPARCVFCCVCGVLGNFAPVQRCADLVRCFAYAVSSAPWLLFTVAPLGCVVLRVLGHLAPVHWCAHSVCCVALTVSRAPWLLFTAVPARCVVFCVWCPGPLGFRPPVSPLGPLCRVCGVLCHFAPVHGCACSVCCVACAASWATWLPFTGVPARCVALCVWCPGQLRSCSPVCPRGLLCCVCDVLGHLAPVHQCACSIRCFARAPSCTTLLLFTGVPARCAVLRARSPGPLGSCSPVCPYGELCCLCGVLGQWAPVHLCARSVRFCFVACAVSWASRLLFTGVLRTLPCLCGVLGHVAPVHRCACSVCCVACAVSWATWLPFTGAPAW